MSRRNLSDWLIALAVAALIVGTGHLSLPDFLTSDVQDP